MYMYPPDISLSLSKPIFYTRAAEQDQRVVCNRAIVKPYGVKNESTGMKITYELTIPDTLAPIENPTGHLG